LLTCKQFLRELNDYLEDVLDPAAREELNRHVQECPNCYVVFDTTKKTLRVFKGMTLQAIPDKVHDRLMQALNLKMSEKCGKVKSPGEC